MQPAGGPVCQCASTELCAQLRRVRAHRGDQLIDAQPAPADALTDVRALPVHAVGRGPGWAATVHASTAAAWVPCVGAVVARTTERVMS